MEEGRKGWNSQGDSYLFNQYILEGFIVPRPTPTQWLSAATKKDLS